MTAKSGKQYFNLVQGQERYELTCPFGQRRFYPNLPCSNENTTRTVGVVYEDHSLPEIQGNQRESSTRRSQQLIDLIKKQFAGILEREVKRSFGGEP